MIRRVLKRVLKGALRGSGESQPPGRPSTSDSANAEAPGAPAEDKPMDSKGSETKHTGGDNPWYLDGSDVDGWDKTNANDDQDED